MVFKHDEQKFFFPFEFKFDVLRDTLWLIPTMSDLV